MSFCEHYLFSVLAPAVGISALTQVNITEITTTMEATFTMGIMEAMLRTFTEIGATITETQAITTTITAMESRRILFISNLVGDN